MEPWREKAVLHLAGFRDACLREKRKLKSASHVRHYSRMANATQGHIDTLIRRRS